MKKNLFYALLTLFLVVFQAEAVVVNVDFDARSVGTVHDGDVRTGTLFSGQGVYGDTGNHYWNSVTTGGRTLTDLLASDGSTVTTVEVTISGGDGYEDDAKTNYLLSDYFYNATTTTITGLNTNGSYTVYVYAVGNVTGQGSLITVGTDVQSTSGLLGNAYVLGGNYVIFETTAGATGQTVIESTEKINGFQLVEGEPVGGVIIVDSIPELQECLGQSNIQVKMIPGEYDINESLIPTEHFFTFSGSNCTYDFTGVTFNVDTNMRNEYGNISTVVAYVTGNNNHLFGLTINDIGNERPYRSAGEMYVMGDYNKIEEFSFYVSGSYPYAYGDLFGKGSGYVIKHWKHSALLVKGIGNHILNCYVEMHAYGHGIFMQGSIDTLIEGCYVKGFTRTTDEVLAETSGPAYDEDFKTVWGWPVPAGYTFSLSEDGIRCYNDGETASGTRDTANTTVKNCTVENMRGGVTIGFSNGTNHVSGCTIIGGESGFWPGNDDTVEHCQAEAAYAAIINNPYQNDNDQSYSVTVLRETEVYGNEQLAYIAGSGHDITFLNSGIQPRPYSQTIQMGGRKLGMRYMEHVDGRNNYSLSNTTVTNWTDQPVDLAADPNSSSCNVASYGPVTDNGTGNTVSSISPVTVTASASTSTMYNTVDGNAGTHWTADGDGQWIQYDLGQTRNLYAVSIKWLSGSARRYFFDIQTSNSTTGPWETVFSGASQGVTDDFEEYDFKTQNARYIRVTGHGNSVDGTIQIVDLEVDLKDRFAMVKTKSDAGASYVAQNTVDGNLSTRWATDGEGQWIQYDLLKTKTINAVWLAWHGGNTRTSSFDIMTSDHPMGPWTTVYTGSSSGTTLELEEYEFTPVSARFVRVTGHGNSQDSWNNITEIFINTGPPYCGDGSGTFRNSDYNRDCRIDIVDLTQFAIQWLNTYSMPDLAVMGAEWSPDGYDY